MKKIIFSTVLLNISLIFLVSAKSEEVRHLTIEEHTDKFNEQLKCDYQLIDKTIADNKKNNIEIKLDPKHKDDYEFITKTDSECRPIGKKISLGHKCFPIFDRILYKYFLTKENVHKRC